MRNRRIQEDEIPKSVLKMKQEKEKREEAERNRRAKGRIEEENKKIIKEKIYELLDLGIILDKEIVELMLYNAIENYMEVTHRDIFYLNIEFIEGEF